MTKIINFVSRSELDAKSNLQRFIGQCRDELTVFGKDLDWDSVRWVGVVSFGKLGTHVLSKDFNNKGLDKNFINFAKAYFRYQQGHKPTKTFNEIKALRVIEAALLQSNLEAKVDNISIFVLDRAAQLTREHYAKGAAYHCGRELQRLAHFITEKHLTYQNLSNWRNPISRLKDEIQTGSKAKTRREKRLPSDEILNALAEIFSSNPTTPRDIFTSSIFAMLLCAPSRISEILILPVDCEIEELDSKGNIRYGWRFYSGKGFGANIKWIPTEMVSVAKEAVKRITNLTKGSRALAKWMEKNPNEFYRHSKCPDVANNKPLTTREACQALGFKPELSTLKIMQVNKVDNEYTLNSLLKYTKSRQPKDFPWLSKDKGIKYSNALFCMQIKHLNIQREASPVILWKTTNDVFNNDLSPRYSLNYHQSIFDRYGYLDSDGSRMKVTSHQARHLLNTIAQKGGLSQLNIAKWSGRTDERQNRVYNHMTEYEMVALAEEIDTSKSLFGPSGEVDKHTPITIQEFNTLEKGSVHVTEFGVCVHDFTMTPCEKYQDCLNCTEQVCIKGDDERLKRIKTRFTQIEKNYLSAKKAMEEGKAGADRWYEYHSNTLTRLKELISILSDPGIENGAQIKLRNNKAFSPLHRAIESKLKSPELDNNQESKLLKEVSTILGGGFG